MGENRVGEDRVGENRVGEDRLVENGLVEDGLVGNRLVENRVGGSAELTWRMMRVIRSGGGPVLPSGQKVLLSVAFLGAVVFGTWWTAAAVMERNSAALVFRFGLSVVLGLYYLALCTFVPK